MVNCIIVDDEQHAIDLLSNHISKIPFLNMQFSTTDPVKAFQYVHQKRTDLIFLDIQMPELDGIQFLNLLKGNAKVILTTAYTKYALQGYEHDIIDYLLKPIVFERFLKAVQKAMDVFAIRDHTTCNASDDNLNAFIFIKTEGRSKIVRVLLNDIHYIEGMGNYLAIHTTNSKLITLLTIKELMEKLPDQQFIRIHNSYVVPVGRITEIQGNQLLVEKHTLPIGDIYKKGVLGLIDRFIPKSKKGS
jgi:two-component system, LytTR family, response regulator